MKILTIKTVSQWILMLTLIANASMALAQNALYVANGDSVSAGNGASSVSLLESNGWTVTAVYDDRDPITSANTTLETADLSAYDLIVWGASDNNKSSAGVSRQTSPEAIAALEAYASTGGFVFVTGFDSVASPEDLTLASFLAGAPVAETEDETGTTATQLPSFLTEGVFDITGFDLTQISFDMDAIKQADLNPDEAKCVTGPDQDYDACSWTIRAVGQGCAAYVSIADDSGQVEADPYFESADPTAQFYPYAAALLNFAYHSLQATEEYACAEGLASRKSGGPESIPTLGHAGLIVLSLMVLLGAMVGLRRVF